MKTGVLFWWLILEHYLGLGVEILDILEIHDFETDFASRDPFFPSLLYDYPMNTWQCLVLSTSLPFRFFKTST